MKEELPHFLKYVTCNEFAFDFETDIEDSHLYINQLKNRVKKAKNRAAIQILKYHQLTNAADDGNGIQEPIVGNGNVQELLQAFDNDDEARQDDYRFSVIGREMPEREE